MEAESLKEFVSGWKWVDKCEIDHNLRDKRDLCNFTVTSVPFGESMETFRILVPIGGSMLNKKTLKLTLQGRFADYMAADDEKMRKEFGRMNTEEFINKYLND